MRLFSIILLFISFVSTIFISIYIIHIKSEKVVEHKQVNLDLVDIYANGIIEGLTKEIRLKPESPGKIIKILCTENDIVESGDLLLQLDNTLEEKNVLLIKKRIDGIKLELKIQNEKLALASKELSRIKNISRQNVISQIEQDDVQSKYDVALLEVEKVKNDLTTAKVELEYSREKLSKKELRAPLDCRILYIDAQVGEYAGPDYTPHIKVANTSKTIVRALVQELDAPDVKNGMAAEITVNGVDKIFHGEVIKVLPIMTNKNIRTFNPQERTDTKTREVLIQTINSPKLLFGLTVNVVIKND